MSFSSFVPPKRWPRAAKRIAACAAGILFTSSAALGTSLPDGFQESAVITGLVNPTAVRFSANGQVFVAEKSGLIRNFWDRGLLGLAVDPAFPTRPYLYALYTHDALPGGTAPLWGAPDATSNPCPSPPGLVAGNQSLRFGRENTEFFLGRIDEIRVAPSASSPCPTRS